MIYNQLEKLYDNITENFKQGYTAQNILIIHNNSELNTAPLIKKLLCTNNFSACNICRSCSLFNTENNPDYIKIVGTKIDDIRAITQSLYQNTHCSTKKIYLIENAELLSISASNALLKILEEPPAFVSFILTSANKTLLLPTITSRCLIYSIINTDLEHKNSDYNADLLELIQKKQSALTIASKWLKLTNLQENINYLYFLTSELIKKNPQQIEFFSFLDEIYKAIKTLREQPNSNLILESLLISFTLLLNTIYT